MPFESSGVLSDSGFNNSPLFGNDNTFGGGGGSYNSGTSQTNTAGGNVGQGYVTITAV